MKEKYLKPELSMLNMFSKDVLTFSGGLSAISDDIVEDGHISWNSGIKKGGTE